MWISNRRCSWSQICWCADCDQEWSIGKLMSSKKRQVANEKQSTSAAHLRQISATIGVRNTHEVSLVTSAARMPVTIEMRTSSGNAPLALYVNTRTTAQSNRRLIWFAHWTAYLVQIIRTSQVMTWLPLCRTAKQELSESHFSNDKPFSRTLQVNRLVCSSSRQNLKDNHQNCTAECSACATNWHMLDLMKQCQIAFLKITLNAMKIQVTTKMRVPIVAT